MLRRSSALALAVTLLVACDRGGGDCEARVAVMRDVFARIPPEVLTNSIFEDDRASDLATSAKGEPFVESDVTIHLREAGKVAIEGFDSDLDMVRYRLEEMLVRRDRLIAAAAERVRNPRPPSPPSPPSANPDELDPAAADRFVGYLDAEEPKPPRAPGARIHLAVAPTAPLAELFALLPALPPDAHVALLVRDPRPPPADADLPAAVQPALQRILAWEAGIRENPRLTDDPPLVDTMMTCPSFAPLVARSSAVASVERERMWLREAPGIALECGCSGVDVEGLTAITWRRIRPDLPLLRELPLRLTEDNAAERVRLPATARGEDLIRLVEARGPVPMHLALAPGPG